jgi:hypothetical protein
MDELSRGEAGLVDHSDIAAALDTWGGPDEIEPPE